MSIVNVIISDRSQGQICQSGAAQLADHSIVAVQRDLSVSREWDLGQRIARPRKARRSVQAVYEAANS